MLFCPLWSLYAASPALAATLESLVTGVQYTVFYTFPHYRSVLKRHALLS